MTSDLPYALACAAAYQAPSAGSLVIRVANDLHAVLTGRVLAVCGTIPTDWENWRVDADVWAVVTPAWPSFGRCDAGATEAAAAIFAALPPSVRAEQLDALTGHSLGGWIAVPLAAMFDTPPGAVVTWDAPKGASPELVALLAKVAIRQYRFRGSIVTDWPLLRFQHAREPLIDVGAWTFDTVEAHSIGRAAAWLAADEAKAPAPA